MHGIIFENGEGEISVSKNNRVRVNGASERKPTTLKCAQQACSPSANRCPKSEIKVVHSGERGRIDLCRNKRNRERLSHTQSYTHTPCDTYT